MESFVQYHVDGTLVSGMLHTPDLPRPTQGFPCVVCLHRWMSHRVEAGRLFVLLARRLNSVGVAAFRFDFRGCGESEGDLSGLTLHKQRQDVQMAFQYLRRQQTLDPERLMLLGYELGGLIATLCAPEVRPQRLALWAPALPERWLPYLNTRSVMDARGNLGNMSFIQEVVRSTPLETAQRWGGVAQVFHGDQDQLCPPVWGVQYAQALNCEAVGLPGADHTFSRPEDQERLLSSTVHFVLGHSA